MNPTGFIDPESGYALDDIPYVKTLLKMALWMPGDKLQTVCPREWEVPVMEQHVGTLDAVHRTYLNRTNIRLGRCIHMGCNVTNRSVLIVFTAQIFHLNFARRTRRALPQTSRRRLLTISTLRTAVYTTMRFDLKGKIYP